MLRAVRKHLRQVRYYSAPRRRTRAGMLIEWSMLAALLLCVPVTYLISQTVHRTGSAMDFEGRLVVDRGGEYHASLADLLSNEIDPIWYLGEPVAEFDLTASVWNHGWPIATSQSRAPVTVAFTPFDARKHNAAALANDPGVRDAIRREMAAEHERLSALPLTAAHDPWQEGERAHSTLGWGYAIFVTFLMLMAVFMGPLLFFEMVLRVRGVAKAQRDAERRARGLCARCGYNLTGNEFSERCPECGNLV